MGSTKKRAPIDLELEIDKIVYGAYGLARSDEGKVYLIESTLPGDHVVARVPKRKKDYGKGWVRERLGSTEPRQTPRCRHFEDCGGCNFQDVTYERSLIFKHRMVVDAVERLGDVDPELVAPVVASPQPYGYRRRANLKVTQRSGDKVVGFYKRGTRYVIDLEHCPVLVGSVERARKILTKLIGERDFDRDDLSHLQINATAGNDQVQVVMSGNASPPDLDDFWTEFKGELPPAKGLIWESHGPRIWGEPHLEETVVNQPDGPLHFRIGYGSFFQINAYTDQLLFRLASEAMQLEGGELVYDVYAGVGPFALRFAREGARVVAIESNPSAAADARHNVQLNDLSPDQVRIEEASAADGLKKLSDEGHQPDALFLDPSRAGTKPDVREAILSAEPTKLVYLSCNASTLARDLKHLSSKYRITRMTPIDLFPQTAHIEVLTTLQLRG